MTEQFDPYYQWLGIRPEEQPPNHYQLLGLRCLEDDPEAIQHAADRQTAHLRTLRTNKNEEMAKKLLDEVAAATRRLLTPERKAAYDASLQGEAEPTFDDSFITESWLHATPVSRQKKRQSQRRSRHVAMIGELCAATLLFVGVLWIGRQSSTETPSPRRSIVSRGARPASSKPSRPPEWPVDEPPKLQEVARCSGFIQPAKHTRLRERSCSRHAAGKKSCAAGGAQDCPSEEAASQLSACGESGFQAGQAPRKTPHSVPRSAKRDQQASQRVMQEFQNSGRKGEVRQSVDEFGRGDPETRGTVCDPSQSG